MHKRWDDTYLIVVNEIDRKCEHLLSKAFPFTVELFSDEIKPSKIRVFLFQFKILKIGRSPPRGALCDLDPNAPLEDDTRKLRLARRVSFAETCQVK